MTVMEIIGALGIGVAIGVPVLLTWWQLRRANTQNRAQFIIDIFTKYTSDPEALEILYRIEHERWKFDETTFPMSADERALDKLLYVFEQISALYEMNTIKRKDLRLIEYDFLRVYRDKEVQKYFCFLDRTDHDLPTDRADFNAYRRVAGRLVSEFMNGHPNWRPDGSSTGLKQRN